MISDRFFLIIFHISRSHRYILFSIFRSLFSKWFETLWVRRFSDASFAILSLITRSISFFMLTNSSLSASSILSKTWSNLSNSRLIWKYNRLVMRSLKFDAKNKDRWRRQKSLRALINFSCFCSSHSSRISSTQTVFLVNKSIAAAVKIDQSLRNVVKSALLILR